MISYDIDNGKKNDTWFFQEYILHTIYQYQAKH